MRILAGVQRRGVLVVAMCVVTVLSACSGGGSGPSGPSSGSGSSGGTGASSASMAAQIGASSWHAGPVIAVSAQGTINISGTDSATFVVGFKVKASFTGTFPLPDCTGPGGLDTGTNGASVVNFVGTQGWSTDCTHTGSVTITSFSSTGASGTFAFTGAPSSGTQATGTLAVTNGTFSVAF
jgi:hypothetical protein